MRSVWPERTESRGTSDGRMFFHDALNEWVKGGVAVMVIAADNKLCKTTAGKDTSSGR